MNKVLLFVSIMLVGGCDSFPRSAYSLGSTKYFAELGGDEKLCDQLEKIALRHELVRREPSRPNTKCYFSKSEYDSIVLGARILNNHMVVDVQAFNHVHEYRALNAEVKSFLEKQYQGKFLEVIE